MADDDIDFQASLNKQVDEENQFAPTSLPQVLSCNDCKALVLEANRGEHFSWHIWLEENFHDHVDDEELD